MAKGALFSIARPPASNGGEKYPNSWMVYFMEKASTKMDDISRATTKIKEASLLSYLQYECYY